MPAMTKRKHRTINSLSPLFSSSQTVKGDRDSTRLPITMSQSPFSALVGPSTTLAKTVCRWPPHPISDHRDLDLTQCFERAVLLPLPLIITLLVAISQLILKSRRLKRPGAKDGLVWIARNAKGERICRTKVVLLSISALLGLGSLVLSALRWRELPYSVVHYALYVLVLVALVHLTTVNHHTSRTSSSLVLLFWPTYLLIAAIRIRTMIITGELSSHLSHTSEGRLALARQSLWIGSIALGLVDFSLELYSPEKRWKKWRAPWSKRGKIALEEDEEDDSVDGVEGDYGGIESPVLVANIYERLSFSWLTPLLSLGTRKFLGEEDMWSLPPSDSAEALSNRLHNAWQEQVQLVKDGKKKKASLKIAIAKAYGRVYLVAGILKALYDAASFLQPQLLRLLLRFISSYGTDYPMPPVAGFGISILMFLSANVATAMLHQYFDRCFSTSESLRTMPADNSYAGQGRFGHIDIPKIARHEQRRKSRSIFWRYRQSAVGRRGSNCRSGSIRSCRLVGSIPDHSGFCQSVQLGRMASFCRCCRHGHFGESSHRHR